MCACARVCRFDFRWVDADVCVSGKKTKAWKTVYTISQGHTLHLSFEISLTRQQTSYSSGAGPIQQLMNALIPLFTAGDTNLTEKQKASYF